MSRKLLSFVMAMVLLVQPVSVFADEGGEGLADYSTITWNGETPNIYMPMKNVVTPVDETDREITAGVVATALRYYVDDTITLDQGRALYFEILDAGDGNPLNEQHIADALNKGFQIAGAPYTAKVVTGITFDEIHAHYRTKDLDELITKYIISTDWGWRIMNSGNSKMVQLTVPTGGGLSASNALEISDRWQESGAKAIIVTPASNVSVPPAEPTPTTAAPEVHPSSAAIYVNNELLAFDPGVGPVIIEGRTLVPLRKGAEAIGLEVDWKGETQTITLSEPGIELVLTIDSTTAYLNGGEVQIETVPILYNGSTYIPYRIVCDHFHGQIDYDPDTDTITVIKM